MGDQDAMKKVQALFASASSTDKKKGLITLYKHLSKFPTDFEALHTNKVAIDAFHLLANTVDTEQQTYYAACVFAICKEDSNWSMFVDSGGLDVIPVLLESDVDDVKGHSVTTVALLSQDEHKHIAMCKADICLPLLRALDGATYERLAEQVAACICNLAAVHDEVKVAMQAMGMVGVLLQTIRRFKSSAFLVRAIGSLANLASIETIAESLVNAEGGEALQNLMGYCGGNVSDDELRNEALRCVCTILEHTQFARVVVDAGVMSACVPTEREISEGNATVAGLRFSFRICANVAASAPELALSVIKECGRSLSTATLVDDPDLLMVVAVAYTNLLNSPDVVPEFMGRGGLDGLSNLVLCAHPEVASQGIRALASLIMHSTKHTDVLAAVASRPELIMILIDIIQQKKEHAELHEDSTRLALSGVSNLLADQSTREKLVQQTPFNGEANYSQLLSLLQDDDSSLQFLAYRSLTYLSMVNMAVEKLYKLNAIEYIILPLSDRSSSADMLYYGAIMLGNFAVKPRIGKSIVGLGGAGVLLNMAQKGDQRLRSYVLAAIGNLAVEKANHRALVDNGCIQLLVDCLTEPPSPKSAGPEMMALSSQIRTFAVRALADLASTDLGRDEMQAHPAMRAALDSSESKDGRRFSGLLFNSELARLKYNIKVGSAIDKEEQLIEETAAEAEAEADPYAVSSHAPSVTKVKGAVEIAAGITDQSFQDMSATMKKLGSSAKKLDTNLDAEVKNKQTDKTVAEVKTMKDRNQKHGWDGEVDINDCVFEERVGLGSYGEVFKGRYRGVKVAIKRLWQNKLKDEADIEYFIHEVKVMRMFNVPSIVEFRGACTIPPNLLLVTEFMDSGNLAEFTMDTTVDFPWKLRLRLLADGAHGLAHMHSFNPPVVHRDLKPENLLLTTTPGGLRAKIADFGLSKIKDNSHTMTVCGTPAFMAPEVLRGEVYSLEADVYSFGCIMWQVATRNKLFETLPPFVAAMKVAYEGLHPPMPAAEDCPFGFVGLMQRCLDHHFVTRPRMREVLQELETILATTN